MYPLSRFFGWRRFGPWSVLLAAVLGAPCAVAALLKHLGMIDRALEVAGH